MSCLLHSIKAKLPVVQLSRAKASQHMKHNANVNDLNKLILDVHC